MFNVDLKPLTDQIKVFTQSQQQTNQLLTDQNKLRTQEIQLLTEIKELLTNQSYAKDR